MEKPLEAGTKCWMFWHGMLSIVTIIEPVNMGYRFKFESGLRRRETHTIISDALYRFPVDKTRLIEAIDREVESMMLYKSTVILERVIL